ncbi:MAG: M23 family metallopeptidase [Phreatobacter sp.]|uniref:M23 family metallopeptidase n=1 Tax=Phreatobacter sp. TaxID=1966341 RepID=UPI00273712C3|nr:M23 family metallopeptidase [Phreatobacter sp.]MDP2802731.1 M23 family metallopeptidase [Phreatobacter sp.]
MPQPSQRYNRAQLAQEANLRAQVPTGALTFAWRGRAGTRTLSLSFALSGTLLVTALALSLWGVAVTSYLAFKDDIIGGVMSRQAALQHGYEDRIRELRGQVDRMTSRQMVDKTELERRVDQVARRQALLETRQAIVSSLKESAGAPPAPTRIGAMVPGRSAAASPAPRPAVAGDTVRLTPPVERQSRLESRVVVAAIPQPTFALAAEPSHLDVVARVERSLDRVEQSQHGLLQGLETRTERRAKRIRAMLAELGLAETRLAPAARGGSTAGTGGPLIPLSAPMPDASPFEKQVFRLQTVIRDHDRLNRLVASIPIARPHSGELELSSGFGARLDPFLRTWAMHSGIDFRGATGEPVFASGSGRVSHAASLGGYGLLVEIDHGNGISTRYAHLSRIEVKEGDLVGVGQRVGRVGSTGRSTGPHLHYETRVNGEAVDPMRFVRAGVRLASAD